MPLVYTQAVNLIFTTPAFGRPKVFNSTELLSMLSNLDKCKIMFIVLQIQFLRTVIKTTSIMKNVK